MKKIDTYKIIADVNGLLIEIANDIPKEKIDELTVHFREKIDKSFLDVLVYSEPEQIGE